MIKLRSVIPLVVAVFACATEPDANVSGIWDLTENITSGTGISCDATGELLLSQSTDGVRFTGQRSRSGTCTGAPVGFTVAGATGIIGGEVDGSGISMEIDFCDYVGTLANDSEMSGTFECPDGISTLPDVVFTGTWQASR